ncbi:DEAD/DEAH box helicase domain protein [Chthoniobacter flavus Ellin428]|uniref:DEAD-box ATP-dependent RNA helicase RhpA n=1 Tax=Chthoniobacter flavus Ellin428 TaxID=497964 RepID=B4D0C0_9BACT|nr:DEAD/DEAH box helicase [Chthoniobacter flavus]EDY20434.1 DEAD/DEAH box helicase domain protein [Chthoniobacter flavus Ellin428]TCO83203.1 ATP-dependent RNA helicase RhlE [Chthoniobacter flavus]
MPFAALGLEPRLLSALKDAGYTEPTPIQGAAIPKILSGSDVIGIAQTGTGKTAAFVLPMLQLLANRPPVSGRKIRALVLAPTRELAAQIEENARAYARYVPFRMATIFGGVGERPQIQALRDNVELIIACPGRLLDLMQQRHGDFTGLEFLVLDEADRMLDMGFLPDIRRIVKQLPRKRQTLLFSATLSGEIEALTHEFLHNPATVQVGRRSNPAETVTQVAYEVPKHLKLALLAALLNEPGMESVLVFSRTKHGADRIARKLESSGIKSATLHSNRTQNQRLRALAAFKAGEVRVLVATDIAARGIDVDGISHVINYDFPMTNEDYVHRIGRTGRANAVGDALSFVCPDEHGDLRSLERFIGRGLPRRRLDNFDYSGPAPAEPPRPPRGPRPPQGGGRRQGASGGGHSHQGQGRGNDGGSRGGGQRRGGGGGGRSQRSRGGR